MFKTGCIFSTQKSRSKWLSSENLSLYNLNSRIHQRKFHRPCYNDLVTFTEKLCLTSVRILYMALEDVHSEKKKKKNTDIPVHTTRLKMSRKN